MGMDLFLVLLLMTMLRCMGARATTPRWDAVCTDLNLILGIGLKVLVHGLASSTAVLPAEQDSSTDGGQACYDQVARPDC